MNGLPLTHFTLEGSLLPFYRSRRRLHNSGRFSRKLLSNTSFRSLALRQLQLSTRNILALLSNVITPIILSCKGRRHQRWLIPLSANPIPVELSNNSIPISPVILEEDFLLRKDVYLAFPPEVNDSTIREAIRRF